MRRLGVLFKGELMKARRLTFALATGVAVMALGAGPAMAKELRVGVAGPQCKNPDSSTIQGAVTAASPGDKIKVCPGTYTEQVTIPATKDGLKLESEKPLQAIIKAPAVMVDPKAIVHVDGARDVDVSKFTITGPGGGICDSLRFGVLIDEDGEARIRNNHITEIRDNETPVSGCQNGTAVQLGQFNAGSPTPGSGTIEHNVIDKYQKNGVTVNEGGSFGQVSQNEIRGIGPTPIIAQNGIQFGFRATGGANQNKVADNQYTGLAAASSTGVLLIGDSFDPLSGGVKVQHNELFRNDYGFYSADSDNQEIKDNYAHDNTPNDGLFFDADSMGNEIKGNKALNNGEHDCHDDSTGTGSGTPATANEWKGNKGGTQNRDGLCKDAVTQP